MDLVIVESPTKAKTLSKFLGSKFKVLASLGHVRDLPKSQLGVDVEHDFEPQYVVPPKAKSVIKDLKQALSQAEGVWLSTDPDREGEAIAWHITQVIAPANSKLKIENSKKKSTKKDLSIINSQLSIEFKRAVFHEITKTAVAEAFEHPRNLDINLINSQQARRILDRLVGYKLSPLLWKKVARNLSAGRVQSVAVRLIVERERERLAFKPEEYWTIAARLSPDAKIPDKDPGSDGLRSGIYGADPGSAGDRFEAQLIEKDGQKIEIGSEKEAQAIESDLRNLSYQVKDVRKEEKKRYPAPPFTTSTLQQAGVNKLGFSASRTMKAAQGLYEKGLITYMRTDSVNLSGQFLAQAANFIGSEFGPAYAPEHPIQYKTKSRLAQEAHEAIRPTDLEVRGQRLEASSGDEKKIYSLIYNRALASQMNPAVFDSTTVDVTTTSETREANSYLLRATGSVLKFDGWLRAFGAANSKFEIRNSKFKDESVEEELGRLPDLRVGQLLGLEDIKSVQHFTQAAGRFTEATLVKALEEHGIGRPSTYAPIISTIQYRGYVGKEGRYLFPQDLGLVVNDLLVANFPKIVDLSFTSQMEADLDEIAEGKREWVPLIREFYGPFEKLVAEKEEELKKQDFTTLEKLDEKCPECGKELIVKIGKFGKFISCSGFPECKFSRALVQPDGLTGETRRVWVDETQLGKCPNDGGVLAVKRGRFGQFVACENYPHCKFTKPYLEKIGLKCPQCKEGEVIVKQSRFKKVFYGCSNYPKCKFASWTKPNTADSEKRIDADAKGEKPQTVLP